MPPRRKKEGGEKRAPRAKKPVVSAPPKAPVPWEPSSFPKAEDKPERIPAVIPIKPAPPVRPAGIKIEPEIHVGEMEDAWTPPVKKGVDLSTPPKPLLQSKPAAPKTALEEFLEEEEDEDERNLFQPPVRTGAFRKIALGFAVLALLVGAGIMYVVYAQATVSVYPQKAEVKTERSVIVTAEPKAPDDVEGKVAEVTVAGEKTEAPATSTKKDGVAHGFATLYNESPNDQVLIPTTRLLTPNGVLFRIKGRVNVPAGGSLKTEVYADQPGEAGDIGLADFTIPGLNAALQKAIYAKSDEPMTGGVVATGTVTQEDIDRIEAALRSELVAQAQKELGDDIGDAWTGTAVSAETMNRTVSVGPGETADGVTVRMTIRVREVGFDRVKAVNATAEDLKRSLTSDRELTGIKAEATTFSVERADPKNGTATVRVSLTGESRVSIQSPLFDATKLRGLDIKGVQAYFEGIEGVERVDVKFRPFWLKRMPLLPDRIEFQIEK